MKCMVDDGTGMTRCAFCVQKSFHLKGGHWKGLLTRHLEHAHLRKSMYLGGYKRRNEPRGHQGSGHQGSVIRALYDGERLQNVSGDDYLERSARIIRSTSCNGKVKMKCLAGDRAVLVIDSRGPRFTPRSSASTNVNIWHATKYIWLTRSFVEAALVALLQHDGQIRPARTSLILKFTQAGNEIALLTPTHQHDIRSGIGELFLRSIIHI